MLSPDAFNVTRRSAVACGRLNGYVRQLRSYGCRGCSASALYPNRAMAKDMVALTERLDQLDHVLQIRDDLWL